MEKIRDFNAYREARKWLAETTETLSQERDALEKSGHSEEEIADIMESDIEQWAEMSYEVEAWEARMLIDFEEIWNLEDFGKFLVALRKAKGLTEEELAQRLGDVSEQQVKFDERNEYQGISVERYKQILDAMKVHVVTILEFLE